ncbi:MAG: ABC transporter permease [Geminicoccaceae bacterium]
MRDFPADPSEAITVSTPDAGLNVSWRRAVLAMAQDLWSYRWQIWIGFARNFRAQVRSTALGAIWSFGLPLVPIMVFVFLKSLRIFSGDHAIHPTLYVTVGMTLWLLIAGSITAPLQALQRERAMLVRSRFPLAGAVLVSYGEVLFETLVRVAAAALAVLWFAGLPPASALLLPLLLVPPVLLGLGLGLLLAVANVVAQDVRNGTNVVLRYLIFVSYAIFPLPEGPWGTWLYLLNPFAILIDNIRSVILLGRFDAPVAFTVVSVLAILVFILACRVLHVTQERIRGFL